jgi:hypothetical protein
MTMRTALTTTVLLMAASLVLANEPYGPRDIGGSWERYPSQFSGLGSDRDAPTGPQPVPAPPLKPEYLENWRALRAEIQAATERGEPPATHYTFCVGDGMPAMMAAMFPMEVLDTGSQITIIQEAYNQVRRIYLDEPQIAPEDAEPRFAGHSVARWDGDTLVVDTVGIKEYVEYLNVPHSANMRIIERISLLENRDYLRNEIEVIDPEYLTEPWRWTWMYRRWPGYKMQEYVCEDNLWDTAGTDGAATLRIDLGGD